MEELQPNGGRREHTLLLDMLTLYGYKLLMSICPIIVAVTLAIPSAALVLY